MRTTDGRANDNFPTEFPLPLGKFLAFPRRPSRQNRFPGRRYPQNFLGRSPIENRRARLPERDACGSPPISESHPACPNEKEQPQWRQGRLRHTGRSAGLPRQCAAPAPPAMPGSCAFRGGFGTGTSRAAPPRRAGIAHCGRRRRSGDSRSGCGRGKFSPLPVEDTAAAAPWSHGKHP